MMFLVGLVQGMSVFVGSVLIYYTFGVRFLDFTVLMFGFGKDRR